MHAFVEESAVSHCDSPISSLSWMGRTPDGSPEPGHSWCLNESAYYEDGWLASGNSRGVVGVTFTSCRPASAWDGALEAPLGDEGGAAEISGPYGQLSRTNFNLRGHRSEISFLDEETDVKFDLPLAALVELCSVINIIVKVMLVRWNEPFHKLATCDVTGIIFVWIKHDGRWSIELINDRSSQVTDFAWSHDGQMALICYRDSFVLVGSVAGQRYWSSMLNLEGCLVTCGVWSPDDQKVMFGTTAGKVVVMTASGSMVAQLIIHDGLEITQLLWSCQRFYMVDQDTQLPQQSSQLSHTAGPAALTPPTADLIATANADLAAANGGSMLRDSGQKNYILAVCLSVGDILLMSSYDDVCPRVIHSSLSGVKMEWSNDGELLAVTGYTTSHSSENNSADQSRIVNEVRFYKRNGRLQSTVVLPSKLAGQQPVSAVTWGHNDRRVFVAAGCDLYTIWVIKGVASLQLLCKRCVQKAVPDELSIIRLPLPSKLHSAVTDLYAPTVKGYIPQAGKLREFVCSPPPLHRAERLHCTIVRHGDETSGGHYTLYLEHLGGLVPLLKGKRASKLHPDFVIFDPQLHTTIEQCTARNVQCDEDSVNVIITSAAEDSDNEATTSNPSTLNPPDGSPVSPLQPSSTGTKSCQKSGKDSCGNSANFDSGFSDDTDGRKAECGVTAASTVSWSETAGSLNTAGIVPTSAAGPSSAAASGPAATAQPAAATAGPSCAAASGTAAAATAATSSPGSQHKKRFRRLTESLKCREYGTTERPQSLEEPACDDGLPEAVHLVEITSNIWGTKFRFTATSPWLPTDLGSVTYKTSLLHLQPRQMTVGIVDLSSSTSGDLRPESVLDPTSAISAGSFGALGLLGAAGGSDLVGSSGALGSFSADVSAVGVGSSGALEGSTSAAAESSVGSSGATDNNIDSASQSQACSDPTNQNSSSASYDSIPSNSKAPYLNFTDHKSNSSSRNPSHLSVTAVNQPIDTLDPTHSRTRPTLFHDPSSINCDRLTRVSPTDAHPFSRLISSYDEPSHRVGGIVSDPPPTFIVRSVSRTTCQNNRRQETGLVSNGVAGCHGNGSRGKGFQGNDGEVNTSHERLNVTRDNNNTVCRGYDVNGNDGRLENEVSYFEEDINSNTTTTGPNIPDTILADNVERISNRNSDFVEDVSLVSESRKEGGRNGTLESVEKISGRKSGKKLSLDYQGSECIANEALKKRLSCNGDRYSEIELSDIHSSRLSRNGVQKSCTSSQQGMNEGVWWADRACEEILFIDDDCNDDREDLYSRQTGGGVGGSAARSLVHCTGSRSLSARDLLLSAQPESEPIGRSQRIIELERCAAVSCIATPTAGRENSSRRVVINSNAQRYNDNEDDGMMMQEEWRYVVTNSVDGDAIVVSAEATTRSSFEPRKAAILLNHSDASQTSTVVNGSSSSPEAKPKSSRLREMARNALCHNRRSVEASLHSSCGSGLRRRGRGNLCGLSNPILPGGCMALDDRHVSRSSESSNHSSPAGRSSNQNAPLVRGGASSRRSPIVGSSEQRGTSLDARWSSPQHSDPISVTSELVVPMVLVTGSTSLPASPVHRSDSSTDSSNSRAPRLIGRTKFPSPLKGRGRYRRGRSNSLMIDSTGNNGSTSGEVTTSENYRDLETFQKAQLNKKLRKVRHRGGDDACDSLTAQYLGDPCGGASSSHSTPRGSPLHRGDPDESPRHPWGARGCQRRMLVMYNKAPMWNEASQVYQLDFGGRVTQESAKNFQIEYGGKQVMQFGRIDNNAYTLDFQYPYSAVQAFAVALANVTQRLK